MVVEGLLLNFLYEDALPQGLNPHPVITFFYRQIPPLYTFNGKMVPLFVHTYERVTKSLFLIFHKKPLKMLLKINQLSVDSV